MTDIESNPLHRQFLTACPFCKIVYEVDEKFAGTSTTCVECGARFVVSRYTPNVAPVLTGLEYLTECPHCHSVFEVKAKYEGRSTTCTECGGRFVVSRYSSVKKPEAKGLPTRIELPFDVVNKAWRRQQKPMESDAVLHVGVVKSLSEKGRTSPEPTSVCNGRGVPEDFSVYTSAALIAAKDTTGTTQRDIGIEMLESRVRSMTNSGNRRLGYRVFLGAIIACLAVLVFLNLFCKGYRHMKELDRKIAKKERAFERMEFEKKVDDQLAQLKAAEEARKIPRPKSITQEKQEKSFKQKVPLIDETHLEQERPLGKETVQSGKLPDKSAGDGLSASLGKVDKPTPRDELDNLFLDDEQMPVIAAVKTNVENSITSSTNSVPPLAGSLTTTNNPTNNILQGQETDKSVKIATYKELSCVSFSVRKANTTKVSLGKDYHGKRYESVSKYDGKVGCVVVSKDKDKYAKVEVEAFFVERPIGDGTREQVFDHMVVGEYMFGGDNPTMRKFTFASPSVGETKQADVDYWRGWNYRRVSRQGSRYLGCIVRMKINGEVKKVMTCPANSKWKEAGEKPFVTLD